MSCKRNMQVQFIRTDRLPTDGGTAPINLQQQSLHPLLHQWMTSDYVWQLKCASCSSSEPETSSRFTMETTQGHRRHQKLSVSLKPLMVVRQVVLWSFCLAADRRFVPVVGSLLLVCLHCKHRLTALKHRETRRDGNTFKSEAPSDAHILSVSPKRTGLWEMYEN